MQQPIATNDVNLFSVLKENQYFDRKSARKDDREIAKHISAFANAAGGKLVIGIEDNGEVTGFKRNGARDIENFERAALTTCTPSPIVRKERIPAVNSSGEDDLILVLDVEASTSHSVARISDGEVFLRQNDKSVRLSREQILALEYDKGQRVFEDELAEDSSMEDIDHDVLDRYKEILGTNASDEQVLRSRRFMRNGKLTVAGALLFAQDPSAMLPQARCCHLTSHLSASPDRCCELLRQRCDITATKVRHYCDKGATKALIRGQSLLHRIELLRVVGRRSMPFE